MASRDKRDPGADHLLGRGGYPVELLHRPGAVLRVRPRDRGRYHRHMNVVYAEALGTGLIMDVFEPLEARNGAGVIDVISSGWRCDRVVMQEHVGLGLIDALCAAGFTVFAAQPGDLSLFSVEAMALHVRAAIRHVKTHAARWGVNARQLVLAGASAGGHLGLLSLADPDPGRSDHPDPWRRFDTSVAAAVWLFPPVDLLDFINGKSILEAFPEGVETSLLTKHLKRRETPEIRGYLERISPWRYFQSVNQTFPFPPMLFIHGTADPLVPWTHSRRMVDLLRSRGVKARLISREGGGHPWPDLTPELDQAVEWIKGCLFT
ncbi:MAG TPA: alpha/beta hydrolase [Candidatus Hydrogenedentes bacterium]|nr:alpha/beta hydrolase [Candidatus Hydrogenedentota bacterium]HPO29598.1 alpha/beta hydrolase [Candidatus Hydrogenedentota bacterium]